MVFKAQSPLESNNTLFYPLTTYDQIIMSDGTRWNGVVNAPSRISVAVLSNGWVQSETGRYTKTVLVEGIDENTACSTIDLDMSNITEDNITDIKQAWSLVDNVETVNGGFLFTAFTEAPAIDFDVIVDAYGVFNMNTDGNSLPDAEGVSF